MVKNHFIYKTNTYSNSVVFLFALLLPLKVSLSNFFLIIYFILSLFRIIKNKKTTINRMIFYSSVLLFIPLLIGCFYTTYFNNALHDIIKKNSFLLIPLFLSFESKDNLQKLYNYAKNGLLLGVIIALLFLLINTIYTFIFINKETNLLNLLSFNYTRHNFTNNIKIHATYLGLYVLYSLVIITNLSYKNKIKRGVFVALFLLFTLGVVFINQRVIFLFFSLIFLANTFLYLRYQVLKKRYLKFLISTVLIVFLGFLSFRQIKKTYIYYRFTKELNWEFSENINSFYIKEKGQVSDPRLARWKGIIKLINKKQIFGYGTGSEKKALSEMFQSKGMVHSYKKQYDSHNQYLSILVEFGFIGFSFFIFHLISNLYFAIKHNNIEFVSILLILIIVSLVENVLSRNNGITFFTFFNTLYLFKALKLKKKYG